MGRLTGRDAYGNIVSNEEMQLIATKGYTDKNDLYNIINHLIKKLAEYEDLESNRQLVKLPCCIGSYVHRIEKQRDSYDDDEYEVIRATPFTFDLLKEIEKHEKVFLTLDEACAKVELNIVKGEIIWIKTDNELLPKKLVDIKHDFETDGFYLTLDNDVYGIVTRQDFGKKFFHTKEQYERSLTKNKKG